MKDTDLIKDCTDQVGFPGPLAPVEKVKVLKRAGFSISQIAEYFGCGRMTITRRLDPNYRDGEKKSRAARMERRDREREREQSRINEVVQHHFGMGKKTPENPILSDQVHTDPNRQEKDEHDQEIQDLG